MALPKKRTTRSARGQRRSHQGLESINLAACPKCGTKGRPHQACRECGDYRGKMVLDLGTTKAKKAEKKVRRQKERENEKK